MSNLAPSSLSGISASEWEFVQDLIRDLEAEEDRLQIASLFGQWRLSLKAFRRVESTRMFHSDPTEEDRKFHLLCVTHLISFGTMLDLAASQHSEGDLANHGLRREIISAMVDDLRNTYDEWHGLVPEERIEELTNQIFNVSPELDFQDSRAQLRAQATTAETARVSTTPQ
jgi:hypothetical protein